MLMIIIIQLKHEKINGTVWFIFVFQKYVFNASRKLVSFNHLEHIWVKQKMYTSIN